MTIDIFVNIPGNLRDAYKLSVPGENRHVDQLMTERRTNPIPEEGVDLRDLWFYTPDGQVYFLEDGRAKLAMTREPENLLFENIGAAYKQLTRGREYHPPLAEVERAIRASTTEIFDLAELEPEEYNPEFSVIDVSTTGYDELNFEKRRLAERVFGKSPNFSLNMEMLQQKGIDMTRVYVLNPRYVQKHTKGGPIVRASLLYGFPGRSYFLALDRAIDGRSHLRGKRSARSL